jgi:hypothetical protein
MKKRYIAAACVIPIVLWLLVPWIILYPAAMYGGLPLCAGDDAESCKTTVALLGQAGDTYGVVSSLFSGLALFAVAATLYADFAARKSSRKPLVVCTIDPVKEITFDEPSYTLPRSVRLVVSLQVKAANESALNTEVEVKFSCGPFVINLGRRSVQIPLLSGDSTTLEFLGRIPEIDTLVAQVNLGSQMLIDVSAKCESIEGLRWETNVGYRLDFRKNADSAMMRLLIGDEQSLRDAWPADASIALKSQVQANSWKYKSL